MLWFSEAVGHVQILARPLPVVLPRERSEKMSAPSIHPNDVSFTKLSELYLEDLRQGEAKPIKVYEKLFPELADQIRDFFPTMMLLEDPADADSTETSSQLPVKLHGCVLEEELGRGAMGIVYRAVQPELDREVAVKLIRFAGVHSQKIVERFDRERRAMARLDHPNIVPIYECNHTDQFAYLVMKYIKGQSLEKLLAERANYESRKLLAEFHSDWPQLAEVGSQVAAGLQHAHESGMVHRDIKPANLIIDQSRKVWITDFGLAKLQDHALNATRTGDVIGTPRYMAPEQLRGMCDARSDVYALGITLYELAIGSRAWDDRSVESLTEDGKSIQLTDVRSVNPEVPPDLARIITKACQFSPDDRYQSALELQHVLERFVHGSSPSDRRKRRREPDDVFRKRMHKTYAAIATAGVLAFLVGLTWFLRPDQAIVASTSIPKQPQRQNEQRLSSPPKTAPPKQDNAVKSSTSRDLSFLSKLAEPDDEGAEKVVSSFVQGVVQEVRSQTAISDHFKDNIEKDTQEVINRAVDQDLGDVSFGDIIREYRKTTLPTATRVLARAEWVQWSGLSSSNKQKGIEILRTFASLIVNKQISKAKAEKLLNLASNGKTLTAREVSDYQISDNKLLQWLSILKRNVAGYPLESINTSAEASKELDRALQRAIKKSKSK